MSHADHLDMPPVFQLKGSMLAITTLELQYNDLNELDAQLSRKVRQAPQFFHNTPLILSLDKMAAHPAPLELGRLLELCRKHSLRTLAVRATQPQHLREIERLDIPLLPPSTRELRPQAQPELSPEVTPPEVTQIVPEQSSLTPASSSRLITHPVRGGQQIYARGDLIVTAPVSAGAELLADGNIHVYGPLRGRALAGIQGDENSRIFCKELSAELISIAGCYQIAESLRRNPQWGESVQVSLSGDVLNLDAL